MSLSDKKIQEEFRKLLEFKNDNEKLEFETEMIHLVIMKRIYNLMDEMGMNKSQLAKELHTSKGYITQLFAGDKIINLKTLAKIQRIFDVNINIEFENRKERSENLGNYDISYDKNDSDFGISNKMAVIPIDYEKKKPEYVNAG